MSTPGKHSAISNCMFATVDLAHLSTIAITGDNTKKFLQGQLTCDVNRLTPNQACMGSYCNIQGRVLSVFHLFEYQDSAYMLMPTDLIASITTTLKKYGQFSRVIIDTTPRFHTYGLIGEAATRLAVTQNVKLPTIPGAVTHNEDYLFIRYPGSNPRWLCLTQQTLDVDQSVDSWRAQDILLGLPEINNATSAQFTPHMLNLKAFMAVSFTKGCYLGQEIIARTEHLGKAKRGLFWSEVNESVAEGSVVTINNLEVGTIINSAAVDNQHALVLAVLNLSVNHSASNWTTIAT